VKDPRVMLVDDDSDDVTFITRAWRATGVAHPLEVYSDGERAWDALQSNRPDAVLLDLKMPRCSGLELLARIRANPALNDLSVFMLTSSRESRDLDEVNRLGIRGYLLKPISYSKLESVIRGVVGVLRGETAEVG
jgi:CheY-like chemotaxis protein